MVTVILAAGLGTRMRSRVPKVLHRMAGRPLLDYPIAAARKAGARQIAVVVARANREVADYLRAAHPDVRTATQSTPAGSGDAVRAALPFLRRQSGSVLILCGDVPLTRPETLRRLTRARKRAPLAIVTSLLADPTGYGRIVRDEGAAVAVVEQRDADDAELEIREVNAGIYLAEASWLVCALPKLRRGRGSEIYLTDLIAMAAKEGTVPTVEADADEIIGVNDRAHLALAEAILRERTLSDLSSAGVTVRDPGSAFVDPSVRVGADTELHPSIEIRGNTKIGRGCIIETGSVIVDCVIGDEVHVRPFTVMNESRVGKGARVGPFAHLRPGSVLGARVHVGNFVETKKARLGTAAKANHHSYLGDTTIGSGSNIGAGTITCNYDGQQKHVTTIGENVFVGSDTQFVAPVRIGRGAYIGAGSTITNDVPAGALGISRQRQSVVRGWVAKRAEKNAKATAKKRKKARRR